MLQLPDDLQAAIRQALAGSHPARWVRDAQMLSERYRESAASGVTPRIGGEREALAYAALLLPATYAQLYGAMAAAAARIPGWAPATLLDLGSGPGTALWAATTCWPSLRSLQAWEREPALIALGRTMAQHSAAPAVRSTRWERIDLAPARGADLDMPGMGTPASIGAADRSSKRREGRAGTQPAPRTKYDLVVLGHVLSELNPEDRDAVVAMAWRLTVGLLLVVEPGTPAGFAVVRGARDRLLAAGAQTIAPCAHDKPCPLAGDWCHFPQRLKRPDFQRRARGAPSEWEDSKYAYAAMARFPAEHPTWGRVIREVTSNKAFAELKISTAEGVDRYRVLKRFREAFRAAVRIPWGAGLDEPPEGAERVP